MNKKLRLKWYTDLAHSEPSLVALYQGIKLRMLWGGSWYYVINTESGKELARARTKGEIYTQLHTWAHNT